MYHRFEENKYPSTNIRLDIFKKHINLIKENNLNFYDPAEFKKNFAKVKEQKKILLTIDDAFTSFYENAWPILKEEKIPFILFVSTEAVGNKGYMSWQQIKEVEKENFTPYLFFGIGGTILSNTKNRDNIIGKNKKLFVNIPFGLGFKYLIKKQFSVTIEFEIKKTFYDQIDYVTGANTKNIDNITGLDFNNSQKNYQYSSGNNNDFYYFTGISLSYIFYKIPCPKDSAPYNSIY